MLKDKKEILDNNTYIKSRRNKKVTDKNTKLKRLGMILSVFISLIIIALIYFISNKSNIYRIVVDGNYYLDSEVIIEESKLSTKDKFLLTFPFVVEKRINENPLIESCKVSLLDNRLVNISIREKKFIGYTFESNSVVLIGENDERIAIDSKNMYLINHLPYIEGFSNDDLVLIEKNLMECDKEVINEISEIHYYPDLKYQNVELIMRDGNYIFTSPYGLSILNKYYDMESSYAREKQSCYYFEDISGNAYTSACPWQKTEETKQDDKQEGEVEEDYYEEDEDNE